MDLNALKKIDLDKPSTFEVIDPATDEPQKGMTITILGQDSAVYRQLQTKKQQAILNRMAKGKKIADLDAEKLAEDTINDLVVLTVSWTGFTMDKEPAPCTPDNVRLVYTAMPWIREQAQEFVNNRANFFR